jgi:hypothetical protein
MFLKNEDIELMIKMEGVIGMNEKKIFGKHKNKPVIYADCLVTYDDFIDYINLITRIQENQKKTSAKVNAQHKGKGKEYHRLYNNYYGAKKSGNIERMTYWKSKLEEYKSKGGGYKIAPIERR